jgi:hypothetical protein
VLTLEWEKIAGARGTKTYVEIAIDEDVFVLDITVRDALTVEVVDGFDDLSEYETGLTLREALVLWLFDAFEEIMRWSAEERRLWGAKIGCERFSRGVLWRRRKVLRTPRLVW